MTSTNMAETDLANLAPESTRSSHTVHTTPLLEGAEHMQAGADVLLTLAHSDGTPYEVHASSYHLAPTDHALASRIDWTFPRLIALFGDFYADEDHPISSKPNAASRQRQASLNVWSLERDTNGYLAKISQVLDEESQDLSTWVKNGSVEAQEYNKKRDTYGQKFKDAIGPVKYGIISWNNLDHFGSDGKLAYIATHGYALDLAAQAHSQSGDVKTSHLIAAYRADAMACHFLTDLFSAGHLRTPRAVLHQNRFSAAWNHWWEDCQYDAVAHLMHDEDCAVGVVAKNAAGYRWMVYGDKQFTTGHNRPNRYMATQGVQASVNEIWQAANQGQDWVNSLKSKGDYAAFRWIPSFEGLFDAHQPAALWKLESNGKMTQRQSYNDRSDPRRFESTNYEREAPGREAVRSWALTNLYPVTRPVVTLAGGFVQIQDLSRGAGYETFFNIWGPVGTLHGSNLSIQNRLLSTEVQSSGTTLNSSESNVLSWIRYKGTGMYRGYDTYFRFHCMKSTNALTVEYARLARPNDTVGWTGDLMNLPTFRPGYSESHGLSGRKALRTVRQGVGLTAAHAFTYTRFFVDQFTYHTTPDDPQLFVWNLSVDINGNCHPHFSMWKSIMYNASSASDRISPSISFPVNDGARFIKRIWVSQDILDSQPLQIESKLGLHLWQWDAWDNHYSVTMYNISEGGKQDLYLTCMQVELKYSFDMPRTRNNWVVLAAQQPGGSLIPGHRQSLTHGVVIEGQFPDLHVSFFDNWQGFINLYQLIAQGTTRNPASTAQQVNAVDFKRYHFAAINQPSPGHDNQTLLVSTVTHGASNYYTHFRTYHNGSYTDSEVPDDLATNPGFASQTWLRTKASYVDRSNPNAARTLQADNAILQIFSFYGVLGCRVFVETSTAQDGSRWALGGQIPYMAQSCTGTGMGCEGRWNFGILPCGEGPEWADIQFWTPKNGWGMGVPESAGFAHGWEHEKMPRGGGN